MTRKRIQFLAGAMLLAGASAALAAEPQRWIHVHVDEQGHNGAKVTINLPIGLIEAAIPLVPADAMANGRIRINGDDFDNEDLRAFWSALREAQDAPYVTIEDDGETVRIEKSGAYMLVRSTGTRRGAERVSMRVPLAVIDALFAGTRGDELDLAAAVRALAASGAKGELITVQEDDSSVRIWIDDSADSR